MDNEKIIEEDEVGTLIKDTESINKEEFDDNREEGE